MRNIIIISLIRVTDPDANTQILVVDTSVRSITLRRIPLVLLANKEGIDIFGTNKDP